MYEAGALSDTSTSRQQQQFSATKSSSTTTTLTSIGSGGSASDSSTYQRTETVVANSTPVLFCTSRGLYLRLAKPSPGILTDSSISSSSSRRNGQNRYDLRFCDLERWSTNRANTIGLDDTIASRTFTIQKNSSLLPTKHSMVRFDTSYALLEKSS